MKIIIVGGSITGASLALAISSFTQSKLQVILIEAKLLNELYLDSSFNIRTIALSYSTCYQFKKIGIWYGLKKYITPITNINISEYGKIGSVNMYAKDYSLPAFGYVIKLHNLRNYLFNKLKETSNIKLCYPDKVVAIERTFNSVSVKLMTGKVVTGQLVVGADGSNSVIGKFSQIEWQRSSYQQCAIVANVLTSELSNGRAFERFTKYGSLAMLPVSKGYSSLVWCHSLEEQKNIMQWDDKQFMMELQNWFGWKLGKIKVVSKRYYLSLLFSKAKNVISHRLVLVGNAAQTLHPIAAQGFNLAIRDVMILADTISKINNYSGDIGDYSVLMKYQMQRQNDRCYIIKLTNNLVRLFSNDNLILSIVRNIGLMAIEVLPFIRNKLVNQLVKQSFIFSYL